MDLVWSIVINTVIALAIFYLLIVIVDIGFMMSFRSIMKHHDHDLSIILTNKRDNTSKLIPLLTANGVKMDKRIVEALNNFDLTRIAHQDGEDAKNAREELTLMTEYFLGLCRDNDKIYQDEEYLLIENNLTEIDRVYREHVTMYNADVLGYNFWVNFVLTRYIYLIFRVKKKDIIN